MKEIRLASYAKINLTLEVSELRSDGYHDIDSVVQVIDIADELIVSKVEDQIIDVIADADGVPSGPDNLVYSACRAFFNITGITGGVRCTLHKNIPSQAGLGGGSGDAATAVMALNDLFDAGLSVEKMAKIAAIAGSDAALFIYGGTVRMQGRGDVITPLPDAPLLDLVVVKPDVNVSTAWAYAELDKHPGISGKCTSNYAESAVKDGNKAALVQAMSNDFDPVISNSFPEISKLKQAILGYGAQKTMLCGSGSAVFGVFNNREQAENAVSELKTYYNNIFVARSLKRQ